MSTPGSVNNPATARSSRSVILILRAGLTRTMTAQPTSSSPADESVSIKVVTAISAHDGVDPTELPPLYDSIDPAALDALFDPTSRGERTGRVRFSHHGTRVTVDADGDISIDCDSPRSDAR